MKKIVLLILLLFAGSVFTHVDVNAHGAPPQSRDSLGVDTNGDGTVDSYIYSYNSSTGAMHIKKGSNITLTVNGDTLVIAGAAGAGTADSMGVDTDGDGTPDTWLYGTGSRGAFTLSEGANITFSITGDTLEIAGAAGGSGAFDDIDGSNDTARYVQPNGDTALIVTANETGDVFLGVGKESDNSAQTLRIKVDTIDIFAEAIADFAGDGLTVSSGKLTADLGTSIVTGEITDGTITEPDLDESGGSPTDNDIATYNQAGTNFTWVTELPDANIADNITASSYLPLSGGTMSGSINQSTYPLLADTIIIGAHDTLSEDHIMAYGVRIEVRNNATGATLPAATPVYLTGGATADIPHVDSAKASSSVLMSAIGLLEHDVANNATGHVLVSGEVTGISTTGLVVDSPLYVASDGGYTATKPTGTNLIQKIGVVTRVHGTQGAIFVAGAGRSNDVPNIASAYFWLGNASAVATAVTMTGDVTMDNAGATTIGADKVLSSMILDDAIQPADIDSTQANVFGAVSLNTVGTGTGPNLNLRADRAGAANQDGDEAGLIRFQFSNDAGTPEMTTGAGILGVAEDITDGTENGRIDFYTMEDGVGGYGAKMTLESDGDLDLKANNLTNVAHATADTQAINLGQLNDSLASYVLNDGDTVTGTHVFNLAYKTSSATPTNEYATEGYVDTAAGQVDAFFTGPFRHSGPQGAWGVRHRLDTANLTANNADTNIWLPQKNDQDWNAADTGYYIGDSSLGYSSALHPSIEYIPWGYGWRDWPLVMVYSVIAKDDKDENGFVAVSYDGDHWTSPYPSTAESTIIFPNTDSAYGIGTQDSIKAAPLFYRDSIGMGGVNDHLSDNDLFFGFDTTLYVETRATKLSVAPDSNFIYSVSTTDLLIWTQATPICSGTVGNQVGDLISMSVLPVLGSKYRRWWVEEDEAADTTAIYTMLTSSPTGWTIADTVACFLNNMPTGWYPWHIKVKPNGLDEWVMLIAADSSARGTQLGDSTKLFLAVSHDSGKVWTAYSQPIIDYGPTNAWDEDRIYRGDFYWNEQHSKRTMELYYTGYRLISGGNDNEWGIGHTTIDFAIAGTAIDVDTTGTKIAAALTDRIPWGVIDETRMDTTDAGTLVFSGYNTSTFDTTAGVLDIRATGLLNTMIPNAEITYGKLDTLTSTNWAGRLTDETGTGLAVFGTAPNFTTNIGLPTATGPVMAVEGDIAYDTDDDWIEVYDGTRAVAILTRKTAQFTIMDPDGLAAPLDTVILLNILPEIYGGGITITDWGIVTHPSSTYSLSLYETTEPDWSGTETNVDAAVATSASKEAEDDGTLTNGTIAVNNFVMTILPATDINMLQIWIVYYVDDNN